MPPLLLAALIVFLEGLSLSALFPVIHVYCSALGGAAVWTGVLFALVAAPKIVFNPVWGRVSDRFGRRKVLMIISFGTMCASIGWAVAPGLLWLAIARTLGGVFGAQATLASAIAADVTRPERRAGGMAMLGIGFGLAFSIGPILGGIVGNLTPPDGAGPDWGPRMVGWMCAGFQFVSLMLSSFVLRETATGRDEAQTPPLRQLLHLIRARHVTPLLLVTLAMTIGLAQLIATFGLYTEERFGWATREVGLAYAAIGVLGAIVQGGVRRMVAMAGERGLTFVGLGLLMLGLASLAFPLTPAEFWA
ncbi:MAG: MFS transporter, partial [Planctomycetota bacterium]